MSSVPVFVPLNRSEHAYVSVGGLLGSILQTYCLRFDAPVSEAELRRALRELVRAFPRLRAVVEPSLLAWRLRILPDDAVVDQLFEAAVRVERGVDPESLVELERLTSRVLNDPVPLERGLPWRAVLLPHATQPVLILAVEHVVCDGRSMVQVLTALMAALNGRPVAAQPLEPVSMLPAILPRRLADWPRCLLAAWRHSRAEARQRAVLRIAKLDEMKLTRFTTNEVAFRELSLDPKELRLAAKRLGTTVNNLVLTAYGLVLLDQAASGPDAGVAIRLSVDLRRYFPEGQAPAFGNYVASFLAYEPRRASLAEHLRSFETQMRDGLARFERREMLLPWLPAELPRFLGRRLYALAAIRLRERDSLAHDTGHFSSLGDCSSINPPQARVNIVTLLPSVSSAAVLLVAATAAGRMFLTANFRADRLRRESAHLLLGRVEASLLAMIEDSHAQAGAAAPAAEQGHPPGAMQVAA